MFSRAGLDGIPSVAGPSGAPPKLLHELSQSPDTPGFFNCASVGLRRGEICSAPHIPMLALQVWLVLPASVLEISMR